MNRMAGTESLCNQIVPYFRDAEVSKGADNLMKAFLL
jgi:hypothetical protein